MLLPTDLDVDILVVVLVQCGHGAIVTDPNVDSIGVLLQSDSSEGDIIWYVSEQLAVLFAKVVILCTFVSKSTSTGQVERKLTSLRIFYNPGLVVHGPFIVLLYIIKEYYERL